MAVNMNLVNIPAGTVWDHSGPTIPAGWLPCDGSVLNIADYPDLFNTIGGNFGGGQLENFTLAIDTGASGTGFDATGAYAPCVIFDNDDNKYKIWYTGAQTGGSVLRILYAESVDGINWTNHQLVIDLGASGTGYDSADAGKPCVIKDGTTYKMWYGGYNNSNWRILYAESVDGINWTNHQLVINNGASGTGYDSHSSDMPCVIKDGTTYKMWYGCSDTSYWRTIYCESVDGINWTNFQLTLDINISGTGYDAGAILKCFVIKEDSGLFKVWYNGRSSGWADSRLLYAESSDGINWSNYKVFAEPNISGTGYDSLSVDWPCIVKKDDYKVWYGGYNGSEIRILHADIAGFNVPDCRGRTVVGAGDADTLTNRVLAETGGIEAHQLSISEIPSHNHPYAKSYNGAGGGSQQEFSGGSAANTGFTGSDVAHNNMQPFMAVNKIIKT